LIRWKQGWRQLCDRNDGELFWSHLWVHGDRHVPPVYGS